MPLKDLVLRKETKNDVLCCFAEDMSLQVSIIKLAVRDV